MDNRDYRDFSRTVDTLNKRYGNFFGYKVVLYTLIASIIYIIIVFGIQGLKNYKDHREQFVLDSNKRYIVSLEFPESRSYYEVDFDKGEVIYRRDNSKLKREKLGKVKTNLEELERLLLNITNDKRNLIITEEDKENLYKQHCYYIYKIKTHEEQYYYTKDVSQIEELKELLSKIE